jgi:hypothetical protein
MSLSKAAAPGQGPSSEKIQQQPEGNSSPTQDAVKRKRSRQDDPKAELNATQDERAAEQEDGPDAPEMDEV